MKFAFLGLVFFILILLIVPGGLGFLLSEHRAILAERDALTDELARMKLENATLYRTLERERRTCELLEDEYQGELASAAAAFAQALLQNSALRQRIVDLAVQNESLRSSQRAIVGSQLHSAEVNRPAPAASDSRPLHAPVDMASAALLALIFAGACVLCLWCFRS